ncbi:MAG: hypothetical protein JWM58_1598 [Rhizobium sp.]|nr:hypothetical protein [Rhizobium sp.]
MVLLLWLVIIVAVLIFFFWTTGLVKQGEANERFDAGLAIVEFGRAYPNEAIRNVIISADGEMVFMRLWTGLAGCMRRNGSRFLCHLIDPAVVRVTPTADGKGLALDFGGFKALSGTFEFRTQREAAEVSLWILGSFTVKPEHDMHMPSHA